MEHSGKKVTVRLERGADIDAACGQLRVKWIKIIDLIFSKVLLGFKYYIFYFFEYTGI